MPVGTSQQCKEKKEKGKEWVSGGPAMGGAYRTSSSSFVSDVALMLMSVGTRWMFDDGGVHGDRWI